MKIRLILSSGLALLGLGLSASASATPPVLVATISGCYDCSYDTPSLTFNNSTGGNLINSQMVLTGYQGDNNGVTATVPLGILAGGLSTVSSTFYWGSLPGVSGAFTPGSLTATDYDDEYYGTSNILPNSGATANCGGGAVNDCAPGTAPAYYANTGNFGVVFTATVSGGTYDGMSVYSVFSPANNATGGFVGWEGLDAAGYSEHAADQHAGSLTGTLANIYLGVPPPPTSAPEIDPATAAGGLALLLGSLMVLLGRRGIKLESSAA